jgi:hypothetical protein
MNSNVTLLKEIDLSGTSKGKIAVSHITHPYGEKSDAVVSIGIALKGDIGNPDWKAHIPYDNVDDIIAALQEAKMKYGK